MPETETNLPVLTVTLGESLGQFSKELNPELKAVNAEDGRIIAIRHKLNLVSTGWTFTVTETRFSSVDFEDEKVRSVLVNPHPEYVTFKEAAKLLETIEKEFTGFGFQLRPDRTLTGDQLRAKEAEIANDPDYHSEVYRARRSNVMCSLVLKKSIRKESAIGQMAENDSDMFLLTLTVKSIRIGDRF